MLCKLNTQIAQFAQSFQALHLLFSRRHGSSLRDNASGRMNSPGSKFIHDALLRLDECVDPIVSEVEKVAHQREVEPGFQGYYVEAEHAIGVLKRRQPKTQLAALERWKTGVPQEDLYLHLQKWWPSLSAIDYGLLLLVLAPDFDPRYERRYGFLHDDVTRRRPSVELARLLLDPTETGCLTASLQSGALLLNERLVEIVPLAEGRAGWPTRELRLDDQLVRLLLSWRQLDPRLRGCCEVVSTVEAHARLPEVVWPALAQLKSLRVYLHGPDEPFNFGTIRKLAQEQYRSLLVLDSRKLVETDRPVAETIHLALREARWFDHLLVVTGVDALHAPDRARQWEQIATVLSRTILQISASFNDKSDKSHLKLPHQLVLLGSKDRLPATTQPMHVMSVSIPMPTEQERFEHWTLLLAKTGISDTDRDVLAGCYPLTRSQITAAVAEAGTHARQRAEQTGTKARLTFDDLALAARQHSGQELDTLTTRITPRVELKEVVTPADVRQQLDDVVARVQHRRFVLREWGFARRHTHGLGINALFAGPPGTGKTMAAEAVAKALGKDLFKIDLTSVVSKYIGETEQKLEQIFRAGEITEAVLFFDEADSLLGKRSEVKDAHDRYANIEVSFLLQRMERYDGLIILATNLLGNLDDAFLRRMAAIVHFPQPGKRERVQLWESIWPRNEKGKLLVPLATVPGEKIDNEFLAERFDLSGGHIRNIALAAAYAAANRPWYPCVTMADVLEGVRREYQKLGQVMSDTKLGLDRFSQPPDRPPMSEMASGVIVTPVSFVTPAAPVVLEANHEV